MTKQNNTTDDNTVTYQSEGIIGGKPTKQKTLEFASTFITPIAPAFAFGLRVYTWLIDNGVSVWLSVVVGASSAIGLEVVGIMAGSTMLEAWRQKKNN